MKKIAFYLFLIIGLISCKGEDGRDGLNGIDGKDGKDGTGLNVFIKKLTVLDTDWKLNGQNEEFGHTYYATTISVPELTIEVMEYGDKEMYFEIAEGVHIKIPYVLHKGSIINGKEQLWTQTFDCEYEQGYVRLIVTYSDFDGERKPNTEFYHLRLAW